jgi:hypothetical protein
MMADPRGRGSPDDGLELETIAVRAARVPSELQC